MHAKSLVLASALAMATFVFADQDGRRFYVPRNVKNGYTNSTTTSTSSLSPETTTSSLPSTTKKDSLSDLISMILGPDTTTSQAPSSTSVGAKPTDTASSGSGLPPIIILPTATGSTSKVDATTSNKGETTDGGIIIGPTGIVSSSKLVSTAMSQPTSDGSKPTSTSDGSKPKTTSDGTKPTSTSDGSKPTTSDGSKPKTTSDGTKPTSTSDGSKATTSDGSKPKTTSDGTKPTTTPVVALPATNTTLPAQSTTNGGDLTDSQTSLRPESTSNKKHSKHTETLATPAMTLNSTSSVPTGDIALTAPSNATATASKTGHHSHSSHHGHTKSNSGLTPSLTLPLPTGSSGLLPSLTSPLPTGSSGLLPSLTSPLPTGFSPTANATTLSTTATELTKSHSSHHHHHNSMSLLPSGGFSTTNNPVQLLPNSTIGTSTSTMTSGSVTSTHLPIATGILTGTLTNKTSTIPLTKAPNATETTGSFMISASGTGVSKANSTASTLNTSHTGLPLNSVSSSNSNGTTSTGSRTSSKPTAPMSTKNVPQSATPRPSSSKTAQKTAVTSLRPTATVSSTDWLPNTIVIEPTSYSSPASSTVHKATTSQALPTTIPKFIAPDDPNQSAPHGTVPIELGFMFPLNYLFVSSNTVAAAQIFKYLPVALADASGIAVEKLQVMKLVPYNTQSTYGYITTLAQLNYPATLVDTLQMDLWSPNSAIYNNADPIVRNLTALINPNIDLHGNINLGGSSSSDGNRGGGAQGNSNNDAFGSGNGGDQSSKQKATTAGIAIAALGFSAMYGAAMFIVARRYKRKRQSHRRSSSIASNPASSDMRYAGNASSALMGGALMSPNPSTGYGASGARESHGSGGHSARTANISAPVATENSLGWN